MVARTDDALHITTTRLNRAPIYRVTVSRGGVTLHTDLDLEADVANFWAGVRLGFAEQDPDLLRRAELEPTAQYDQIRREGILVGLIVAGVAIPPVTYPPESPCSLSCEEVEEVGN